MGFESGRVSYCKFSAVGGLSINCRCDDIGQSC